MVDILNNYKDLIIGNWDSLSIVIRKFVLLLFLCVLTLITVNTFMYNNKNKAKNLLKKRREIVEKKEKRDNTILLAKIIAKFILQSIIMVILIILVLLIEPKNSLFGNLPAFYVMFFSITILYNFKDDNGKKAMKGIIEYLKIWNELLKNLLIMLFSIILIGVIVAFLFGTL